MKINTVIFDLDGTLLNTLEDISISFNYALTECGYSVFSLGEVKSFVGNGIKKAFECAIGDSTFDIEKLIYIFKKYYINHSNEHTKPYEGIVEVLKHLKYKGYKTAVVSNKYDEAVKDLCKKFFGEYIDIAIGESENVKRKPSIDGILEACKYLGTKLNEVIYIGDSEVDILTAKNAKIPCISVLWGFKDKKFLEKNGGNIFVERPLEIIKIVEQYV